MGLLTPAAFIPIAERTGAILPLGHWVFEESCRQLKAWQAEGVAPQVLSVNVSGVQFKGASELEREVEASLTRWGINPSNFELELTESVLMEATQRHSNTLENLRQLGIKISIDDFGTGYSSLKYLTQYPVNRLKLAQEFVFRVTVDYRNAAVVRTARQRAWPRGHRRRGRDRGASALPDGRRLRAGARLLFQPAGAGAQSHGTAARRPDRAQGRPLASARLVGGVSAGAETGNQKSELRSASRRRRSRLVGRVPLWRPVLSRAWSGAVGASGVRSS